MFGCLKKYGFGKQFIHWIEILYNKPTFSVKNNGWISGESQMARGIRQCCAVSALLFILAVEFLAIEIREANDINGIKLFKKTTKLTQYADDTTLTLEKEQSVISALERVKTFGTISGLELNVDKCEGIWLGALKHNPNICEGVKFSKCPVKCLGIYVGTDQKECEKWNWEKKISEIEKLLLIWSSRALTYYGKIVVINNLIVPRLIYNLTILYTPTHI